jgi:GNAT superfamily N-acetyltransferase
VSAAAFSAVQKLTAEHDLSQFDCGKEPLNKFLQRFALTNQLSNSAQTYVVCSGSNIVVGYYSLAVGAVEHAEAPARISRGLARQPIPVMLLARLAIDKSVHGAGLGKALLKDALLRTAQAADIAGIRAMLVHPKDEEAKAWYEKFDFEPSPTDPLHLFLLMKDLKALI